MMKKIQFSLLYVGFYLLFSCAQTRAVLPVKGTTASAFEPRTNNLNSPRFYPPISIVPMPALMEQQTGQFSLCPLMIKSPIFHWPSVPPYTNYAPTTIWVDAASKDTGKYLADALGQSTGYYFKVLVTTADSPTNKTILITTANAMQSLGQEGYELTVKTNSVVIRAPQQAGTFYGVQTLLQLLPPQIYDPQIYYGSPLQSLPPSQNPTNESFWTAPCVYIKDQPTFKWRGVMLDVTRHFFNVDEVEQLIDVMAMHKLNTLDLHLTDDQGWRLEIDNHPELTTPDSSGVPKGAWRHGIDYGLNPRASAATNALGQYGGFYTKTDASNIVAYALTRHIAVVPEIEMPAHCTACLAADPQFGCGRSASDYVLDYTTAQNLNYFSDLFSPANPNTFSFLTHDVLAEIMQIFPSKYICCGGDEEVILISNTNYPGVAGSSPYRFETFDDDWWNTNHTGYIQDYTNMQALGIIPGNNSPMLIAYTNCGQLISPNPNSYDGDISIAQYQHWFTTQIANFIQANGRTMAGTTEIEYGASQPIANAVLFDWQPSGDNSYGLLAAQAGIQVVEAPEGNCYFNYTEGPINVEPPFAIAYGPASLTLSNAYNWNPIPCNLTGPATNFILGAQCALWTEYVPSFRNVMMKLFPRAAALAEVTWTPPSGQNYSGFLNRLSAQNLRYNAMGLNYDHETIPQIASWSNVPASPTTLTWPINPGVGREIDVNFWWTNGDALTISSVSLLVNGTVVDSDVHVGTAETSTAYVGKTNPRPYIPLYTVYVLNLDGYDPGSTYQIQAVLSDSGTAGNSQGVVYMPNWN